MRDLARKIVWAVLLSTVVAAERVNAAQLAADNASNFAYDDGWQTGDNGGFGFGPWSISSTGQGLIGSSTANGDSQPPSGDIDTPGSRSWAFTTVQQFFIPTAVRPLVGKLDVGQHVTFDIDGFCNFEHDDMLVALGTATRVRWQLLIRAPSMGMGSGTMEDLIIPSTTEGVHLDFLLTGPDSYSATLSVLGGQSSTASGVLGGTTGSAIDQIRFEFNPVMPPYDTFYFNSLAVTPEPAGVLPLIALAAAGFGRPLRREV